MNQNTPNYATYSVDELQDVLARIDQARFPERYLAAQRTLEIKLTEKQMPQTGADLAGEGVESVEKPRWAELLWITRTTLLSFFGLLLAQLLGGFADFLPAKRITSELSGLIWGLNIGFLLLWCVVLIKDAGFSHYLMKSKRGLVMVFCLPFLVWLLVDNFVDRVVPLGMHQFAVVEPVNVAMAYEKRSRSKLCQYRLRLLGKPDWDSAYICVSEPFYQKLNANGTLTLRAEQSDYGLLIKEYRASAK